MNLSDLFHLLQLSKIHFHPVDEHRAWCPWVTKQPDIAKLNIGQMLSGATLTERRKVPGWRK